MKTIPLTNGGVAFVDDSDFDYLSEFKWRKKKSDGGDQWHAVRDVTLPGRLKNKVTVRMHRLITESDKKDIVFHINGNGLDNCRSNLQKRTMKPWTGRATLSGFMGVHMEPGSRYHATITFAGNPHNLGIFRDAKQAALVYDDAARRLYGSNARTNFTLSEASRID